jgi:predicted nucleic acid-binding protein/GNAT superfamily N-acetyltransferase
MKIEFINQKSNFLPDIINLGKKNSITLGFMPEGGFIEHARKENIIIAYENKNLIGYLMFRAVERYLRITIVHLCIKEEFRGHDVSTKLLDALREKYKQTYLGISISCRADYEYATKLWQRYGFVSKRCERSRSVEEKYINKWWYDFNQPDLFNLAYDTSVKIKTLLDSNIIIKLRDENNGSCDKSSVSTLLSDWLSDEVDYFFSQEIHNEILRDNDADRVKNTKAFLSYFNEARFDIELSKNISKELRAIISGNSENDESDRKHISSCIASGIPYFVTLDADILSKSEEIESKYDIQIFSPQNFILEIDQLINKELYSPKKLAGVTSHSIKLIESNELDYCIDTFLAKSLSERKSIFRETVNSVLMSKNSEIKIIKHNDSPIAFFSLEYKDNVLYIPFIRILDLENKQTLFMQIIFDLINESLKKNIFQIIILDKYFLEYQKIILRKLGFVIISDTWQKLSINNIMNSSLISTIDSKFIDKSIFEKISMLDKRAKDDILLELEHRFFPLKFSDLDIPCYIIPILPYWAGQLFDINISNSTLFGANPEKLWNYENVYYRHTKPINEIAPGRILWYASKDNDTERSQSIIATSYLNEVMTDKPKVLFLKNKHFGIYEWRNIYELCNKNIEIPIRVLRFSHTELFSNPIRYQTIQQILVYYGRKVNTFPSPVKINMDIFCKIYRRGICQE